MINSVEGLGKIKKYTHNTLSILQSLTLLVGLNLNASK